MRPNERIFLALLTVPLAFLLTAAAPTAPTAPTADPGLVTLESFFGGSLGAGLVALVIYAVRLILDRFVPSRADARQSLSVLIEGLQSMVALLQAEKESDAKTLADRQARIAMLESEALTSYKTRGELQAEIIELRTRIAQRDRHIQQLVDLLASKFGVSVAGYDSDLLNFTFAVVSEPPGSSR